MVGFAERVDFLAEALVGDLETGFLEVFGLRAMVNE